MACAGLPAWACDGPAAKLVSKEGVVEVRPAGGTEWKAAAPDQALCTGDTLAVRRLGRAAVVLPNEVVLRLDQGSVLTLNAFAGDKPSELGLLQGVVHVLTRFTKKFGVVTPYLNAMVDGTEFTVRVADEAASISVTEGHVRAENEAGQLPLTAGLSARATRGQAPAALTLTPADAVQWALYFPQVVQPSAAELQALPPAAAAAAQEAAAGHFSEALAAWPDTASTTLRSARAGWLLALGRVDEAQALLDQEDAGNTPHADSLSVRAVIRVVSNQPAEALADATRAVELAPQRAAPQLALSLALQARRDLPAALAAAQRAVALEGDHALASARLAELQLSSGLLRDGEASARRAADLKPGTPRIQALLGFAQLLRGRLATARDNLRQAQAAFPADPLPHLGLGLVELRSGHLAEGRREIEVAVMLDPGNAELRAWLGRAYLGERRDRVAGDQLDVARGLDPRSPTAWSIDGMRKQRANRPVEAAADHERALELNDQRAVVRPNSLLDTDRAARTAALASVWRDLGFDGALFSIARGALADDPQNEAAHRLLAEAYAGTPRSENARVSELLQTQLRQSPRTEPIAPQELLPGLPVLNGPRSLSLQETSPFFDESRGGARLGVAGGNHGLWGTTASAWTGLGDGQLSFGHFHYQTDGFRPESGIRLEADNLLWQTAVTPEVNAQAEWRTYRRRGGDITQSLLPDSSAPVRQRRFDSDSVRVGVRYAPRPESEWLMSAVWRKQDFDSLDITSVPPLTFTSSGQLKRIAKLGEILNSQQHGPFKWTLGLSVYREDEDNHSTLTPTGAPIPLPALDSASTTPGKDTVLFAHAAWSLTPRSSLQFGFDHEHFSKSPMFISHNSPKVGWTGKLDDNLTLRAAWLRSMKGPTAKEQTLEPTQFNSFNQLFDDPEGTRSERVAAAIDQRLAGGQAWGFELSHRKLLIPAIARNAVEGCDQVVCDFAARETLHTAYYNIRLQAHWSASAHLSYEKMSLRTTGSPFNVPSDTTTWQLPLRVNYFSEAGWSVYGQARHVRQSAQFDPETSGSGKFWLMDAGVRYHVGPAASLTLDVANLFNRQFGFQDTYLSGEPRVPQFQPGRRAMLKAEVRF